MKQDKERYWMFVMYPESMNKDVDAIEYLQATGLQVAISPIHDKDINADGTKKKPHYHVILFFDGPTTYRRVEKITNMLNATIPIRCMSPIGAVRYLTHKDNPEKAQYDEKDIKTLNGLDLQEINGLTSTMIDQLKIAIIQLCQVKNITEYSVLINYLLKEKLLDMFKVASTNTIFINTYLKSRHFSIDEIIQNVVK